MLLDCQPSALVRAKLAYLRVHLIIKVRGAAR